MKPSPLRSLAILSFVPFPPKCPDLDIREFKLIIGKKVIGFKSESWRADFNGLAKIFVKQSLTSFNSIFRILSQQFK